MSLAIIDAREWQRAFDLRTGERAEESGPLVDMVRGVLAKHPYPGDMDAGGNRWVTDAALDLIEAYHPRFAFLIYAQQYFAARYSPMSAAEQGSLISAVSREVDRFLEVSGFDYVVIGTGGLTPLTGFIDLSGLDGLGVSTHWSSRYAGLYGPSRSDLAFLEGHPHVERVVERDEFTGLFGAAPENPARAPEYLILADEGFMFKSAGATMRKAVMIPGKSFHVPVRTTLGSVQSLTDVRGLVDRRLQDGRVAVIMLEGIGMDEFPWPAVRCENGKRWYYYEPGDGQCLTVTSGAHRVFDYPTGYRYFDEDGPDKKYPFSGYFASIPEGTLGSIFPGRSIAVGNKSMFMHMVAGADISVECFARNLYNQGTMGVIHRQDKP